MADKATPTQEAAPPNEAGFSTSFGLNHEKIGRWMFTFRGARSSDWQAVITDAHAFLEHMRSDGWLYDVEARVAQVPPPSGIPAEPPPATGGKFEHKPVPAAELPPDLPTNAEGGSSEYFKDEFDYFVVTPQPDDRANVEFHKDGLKWPVGAPVKKWKHKTVSGMLQAFGEINPAEAKTYHMPGVQYWTLGNEYKKPDGTVGHYKDLKRVEKKL